MFARHTLALIFQELFAKAFFLCMAVLWCNGCAPSGSSVAKESHQSDQSSTAVSAGTVIEAKQNDWPLFRGDARAVGVASSSLPEKLELLWKFPVENGAFESTPVVVDGVVYIGDLDGSFYALDLKTGEKKWTFRNPTELVGFNAAAAVRDGLVYIGDMDGTFFCLAADKGEMKWAVKTEGEISAGANFYKDNVLVGSQDSTLYCLDAKTSERRWAYSIDNQIRCFPTIIENRCFIAGCDGKLHIVNCDDGTPLGSVPIDSPTGSTPAADEKHIYFGTNGGQFFCVDWRESKEVWRWQAQSRPFPINSSAALTPNAVIFGSQDKRVHALDPTTEEPLWSFATKGSVDGSPVVVGNRVFVGSADGRIYGLDLKTGEKVWEYEAGGKFPGSPAVAEGRLLIASNRGVVYCFGSK